MKLTETTREKLVKVAQKRWGDPIKRVWSHVDKSDECWVWFGHQGKSGGLTRWDGRRQGAHRVAWQIEFGPVPEKMLVLHKCKNRLCVRPDHLYLGIRQDTMPVITEEIRERHRAAAYKRLGGSCDQTERFWSSVDKSRGPKECWIWNGYIGTRGYGRTTFRGKYQQAHRVAWQIDFGPIPEGKHVLHRCDNKKCVNPMHLWIGSHKDNMEDKVAKGRQSFTKGENGGNAKLSDEDVKDIRLWFTEGVSQREIAKRKSVGPTTIFNIVHRRTWKHIP